MKRRIFLLFMILFGFNVLSFGTKYIVLPDFEVNGNTLNIPIKKYYSIVSEKLSKHYTILKKNEFNNNNITKVIFHFQIIEKYLFLTVFLEKSQKRLLLLHKNLKKDIELTDNIKNIAQFLTFELRDLKYLKLTGGKSLLSYDRINWNNNEEKKGKIILLADQIAKIYINGMEAGINNKKVGAFTDLSYFATNRKDMSGVKLRNYHKLEIPYLDLCKTYNIILYKFNYKVVSFKVKLNEDNKLGEYLIDLEKIQYFKEYPFLQRLPGRTDFENGICTYKKKVKLPIDAFRYGFRGKLSVSCIVDPKGEVAFAELNNKFYLPYLSTAVIIAAEQCKFSPEFFKGTKLDYYSIPILYKIDY